MFAFPEEIALIKKKKNFDKQQPTTINPWISSTDQSISKLIQIKLHHEESLIFVSTICRS